MQYPNNNATSIMIFQLTTSLLLIYAQISYILNYFTVNKVVKPNYFYNNNF